MVIAFLPFKQKEEHTMRKSISIISMSLLAGSLMIPSGRAYADNPPGNHRQREELRQDERQLEQLRQRRNQELREGDRREAREYNEKIRDQKREIRRDRRDIYGHDRDREYDRDRRHRDRDHDHHD
jgi:hypothetical protein